MVGAEARAFDLISMGGDGLRSSSATRKPERRELPGVRALGMYVLFSAAVVAFHHRLLRELVALTF